MSFNPTSTGFPSEFYSEEWKNGTFLDHVTQSLCLAFALIFGLTCVIRIILKQTGIPIPSIVPQILIGIVLGQSFLGKKQILGPYYPLYAKAFSLENQYILGVVGALGYLFSIFLCGLRADFKRPEPWEIIMGLLSLVGPFSVGMVLENSISYGWKLSRANTNAFPLIIYSLSFTPYPTIRFLLEDVPISSAAVSKFLLSSSLYSELVMSLLTWIFTESYSLYNNQSTKKDASISILWILVLLVVAIFIFRPLLEKLVKSSYFNESRNNFAWLIISIAFGSNLISKWFKENTSLPTLLLGLVIPRHGPFVNLLETYIGDCAKIFKLLYITILTMKMDVFSINFMDKPVIVCVILVLVTTTIRFLVCMKIARMQFSSWRHGIAIGLSMITRGAIDMSVYATLRDKQLISDGVYAILILNVLLTSSVATSTSYFYIPTRQN